MRKIALSFLSLAFIGVVACNSNSQNQEEVKNKTNSKESIPNSEQLVNKTEKNTKIISQEQLISKNIDLIKKELRNHLKEHFFNNYKKSIIKHESLIVNNDSYSFKIVLIDPQSYKQTNEFGNSDKKLFSINELGDTLLINGNIKVSKKGEGNNNIHAKLKSEIIWKKLTHSPYRGYYRYSNSDYVGTSFQFDENQKLKYKESDMYLKARFYKLHESDLEEFTKNELSYLRNEIFARHGHIFKTDKMKTYFSNKEWYLPCFNDATPFLNEIEKYNALFIRGIENEK